MSAITAIFGRETKASLASPLAHAFLLIFALTGLALFFWQESFFANDEASIRGLMKWMPLLLAFVGPALTMRMWTDERRLQTLELLNTLPVRPLQVVLGKFLSSLALLLLALLFTLAAPIVAADLGDLDWGPVWGSYLGALLAGSTFLAVGLFTSSLTKDQFVALLSGWAICGLLLLPGASFWDSLLPTGESLKLFGEAPLFTLDISARSWGSYSLLDRFERLGSGVLGLSDALFFAVGTAFFLALNTLLVAWRRHSA